MAAKRDGDGNGDAGGSGGRGDGGSDRDAYIERHWPILLAGCGALILWYTLGGNDFAGAAGFLGLGWLAWDRLIKPRL